jgi:hypothetical protein
MASNKQEGLIKIFENFPYFSSLPNEEKEGVKF